MSTSTLVDVRITCAYQSERDGLQTFSMPVVLVPVCASCFGFLDKQPCSACGAYICSLCTQEHSCSCSWCGALKTLSCDICGLQLCAECDAEHDCSGCQDDALPTSSDGEPEGEPAQDTADAICETRICEPTYTALHELWAPQGVPMARLKDDMWVEVTCATGLCPPRQKAHLRCKAFGEQISDFSLLCEALAWEFPQGIAIIHVDKGTTVVCAPGRAAHAAHVTSALSWLRSSRGQTFGIVLRSVGNRLQGAFLDVLFQPHHDRKEKTKHRRIIIKAVMDLTISK